MTITTTLTRTDCKRDNVKVRCPNASLLGFGQLDCKRGNWIMFEYDDYARVGRSLGRVTCEGEVFIEAACASIDFTSVYIRWVRPEWVREIRAEAPKRVLHFFGVGAVSWCDSIQQIYREMEHGVSDLNDQLAERKRLGL